MSDTPFPPLRPPEWVAPAGKPELVVAVDVPTRDDALRLRDELAGVVPFFKIGKELFTAAGPEVVKEFTSVGRVFLDLKFHDIPATVAGAVQAAAKLGASILNVHASGGRLMLNAAVNGAEWVARNSNSGEVQTSLVLAVTVLTHFDDDTAPEVFGEIAIADQVLRLAGLAQSVGIDGVVASAQEIEPLREAFGEDFVLLVPGIRPAWAAARLDQRRVATPAEAAQRGANYLVVGRAITRFPNPADAALRIREEIEG